MVKLAVRLCILAFIFVLPSSTCRYIKRSPDHMSICSRTTPCGWGVYTYYSRAVQYYMRTPCQCPNGTRCVRTNDELLIYSYVYHCRSFLEQAEHVWPDYQ
ncbi:uncharacterized protein LOC143230549 [Tachypleus tridentatus]|uniref:uncharacterized protein LOC143230549 n=1 Tax=Tachypleus tridentatus TaxID=6853 RepID=UPI003FCF79D9